jgi:hypothetical protein
MFMMAGVLLWVSLQPGADMPVDEGESFSMLERLYSILVRGLFGIPGGVALFASLWMLELFSLYTFDRNVDRFYIYQRYALRSTTVQYPLKRIQSATVGWTEDSDSDRHAVIQLALDSGKLIYISDLVQTRDLAEYEPEAQAIREFLSLSD